MLLSNIHRLSVLAVALSFGCASAQTVVDPAYANMQRVVGGIVQQATQSMGYAASDPRTYGTLRGIGQATASAAAAAGTGLFVAGSAPAWASVLAVAAISGAVSYGVGITLDATVKWAFSSGSTPITVTSPSASSSSSSSSVPNQALQDWASANYSLFGAANSSKIKFGAVSAGSGSNGAYCAGLPDNGPGTFYIEAASLSNGCKQYNGFYYNDTVAKYANSACPSGGTSIDWANCSGSSGSSGPSVLSNQTLADAVNALTAAQKAQPLSAEAIALMINQMWKQAAFQPGYAGVPYSVTNPVTPDQVQAWQQSNPSSYPSVGAFVAPVTTGATGFAPSTTTSSGTALNPATSDTPSTSTNPSTQPAQVNLGPDPNITLQLPDTPTADSIFKPFMDIASPFVNFQFNAPPGVCPKPTFAVFGTSLSMTQHCDILEQLRGTIQTVMSAVFLVAAFVIVFTA